MSRNGFKVIDAEMHVMEPPDLWEKRIDPEFKTRAPRRLNGRVWDIRTLVEGEVMSTMVSGNSYTAVTDAEEKDLGDRFAEAIALNFSPESQLIAMENEGLDLAVLYPTSALYITAMNDMDPRFTNAACHAYNDWLHEYIQGADPKRMYGACAVSPHDIASAVTEVRRSVEDLYFKAVFVRPNMFNNRPWHSSYYDPFWSVAQDLGVSIGFHEATGSRMPAAGADRFPDNMGIAHVATHSIEQMLTCMDIIMGGVMERYPKLRVGFLEAQSGWLPFWLGRMDEHYEWRGPYGEMEHLKIKPSEYFRRQGYCTVECEEDFVSHVIDALGDDNLVTSTDYPHADAKYPNAIDTFLELPISESSKKKILWDNPVKLYSL